MNSITTYQSIHVRAIRQQFLFDVLKAKHNSQKGWNGSNGIDDCNGHLKSIQNCAHCSCNDLEMRKVSSIDLILNHSIILALRAPV